MNEPVKLCIQCGHMRQKKTHPILAQIGLQRRQMCAAPANWHWTVYHSKDAGVREGAIPSVESAPGMSQ